MAERRHARGRLVGVLLALLAAGAAGCAGREETSPSGDSAAAPPVAAPGERAPRTLSIPGAPSPDGARRDEAPAGMLRWVVPAGWLVEAPTSNMRLAQYRVPGDAGAAECVVFYFGPGQGGDPMSNVARWAQQFTQPDGSSSLDRVRKSQLAQARLPVHLVEVTGTYDGGMSMTSQPSQPQPGSMLLGAIVEGPDAPWFFKFTGPEATVRAQRERFVGMLESIRPED